MTKLQLKVCGLKENIPEVLNLKPNLSGFIFYKESPRYFEGQIPETNGIGKVGVFVNEQLEEVLRLARKHGLDYLQLHGDENLAYTRILRQSGFRIIKVFRVLEKLPTEDLKLFQPEVDYFLFDTQSSSYGGSGKKFDWKILDEYQLSVPFLLSGGIGPEDIKRIKAIDHPMLKGIDINSKVEVSPGKKNIDLIKQIIEQL
jgi:phosphoribosylanthranilate isomerase